MKTDSVFFRDLIVDTRTLSINSILNYKRTLRCIVSLPSARMVSCVIDIKLEQNP